MGDRFRLTDNFLEEYKTKKPEFGFNGLGEIVYMRTYSRIKENGDNEKWWETVKRVVEGTYNIQKNWIEQNSLGWNPWKAQKSAQEMYRRMFEFKFLPPGRGLWSVGSPIIEERGLFEAATNCAYVSTEGLDKDKTTPFIFLFDMSMKGVGVGFDVAGAGSFVIEGPTEEVEECVIPDSREGWVESTEKLLDSYFNGGPKYEFDYSEIRPEGAPIKTFGGVAPGPGPLINLHKKIPELLDPCIGKPISIRNIVDLMNVIGKAVVSGGIRRTSEIALGPNDEEYLDLKNYEVNPEREEYGWTSNNTIYAEVGMDYSSAAERTRSNGEPGYLWLDNAKKYSRIREDEADNKDHRIGGVNPCGEQSLEDQELCTLVETFPAKHDSLDDYLKTLKYAYLYGKTITLGKTTWPETNRVMLRNRRIGCSVSGVAQFLAKRNIHELKQWLNTGYEEINRLDEVYSDWMAIPRSIKISTVKPSGSVSLVAGSTPGMHYPESRFYLRRVRIQRTSELLPKLQEAGYDIEPAIGEEEQTVVVSIPIDAGEGVRTTSDVSMWEQLSLAAFLQREWSDNAVSCTVTFDPKTEGYDIENALNYFQYQLKSISFLPKVEHGAYKQMPYEEITEKEYNEAVKNLKQVDLQGISGEIAEPEKFCDGDSCVIT